MKILAHRGLSASFPENTAIAFQQAAKLDCWGVEFDVHLTSDQQLVVIHDETIARFQQIQPQIYCALLFASLITNLEDYVRKFDCHAIHIPYYYSMRSIIQRAIQQGIVVRAYTVNKKEIAQQMEQLHIDAIFSDKGIL